MIRSWIQLISLIKFKAIQRIHFYPVRLISLIIKAKQFNIFDGHTFLLDG